MTQPVVPMFPLPSYFLFPGAASPLRVFEARYREMVADLLDGPGRLVMACVHPDHLGEMAGDPPVLPIGGLGEIVRHRPLPNGEYTMWVIGIGRVRIEEVASARAYRQVIPHLLDDDHADATDVATERKLRDAIAVRGGAELEIPENATSGLLADILAQCLPLPVPTLRACFEELDVRRRIDLVLEAHEAEST